MIKKYARKPRTLVGKYCQIYSTPLSVTAPKNVTMESLNATRPVLHRLFSFCFWSTFANRDFHQATNLSEGSIFGPFPNL